MAPVGSPSAWSPAQRCWSHACPCAAGTGAGPATGGRPGGHSASHRGWSQGMEPGDGVRGRDGAAAGGATADTSAPGGCASGCALSLQAVRGAAAAQLPPALRVLHGDGGAPLHVHLPVLPGQHLHSLRGRHARRCQLPAWAPLHLWQHPQEEAAPAAAGPGEPCRVGAVLWWPTMATALLQGSEPLAGPRAGMRCPWGRRWGQRSVPARHSHLCAAPCCAVAHRCAMPHCAVPRCAAPCRPTLSPAMP